MAGIKFDDLIPQGQSGAISFDDLVPQQPKARAGSAGEAFGIGIAGGQLPFGNVITSGLAAAPLSLVPSMRQEGETIPQAYGRMYDEAQAYTKATQEANPTATTLGNVAGILSTLPAAFSKPVQGAGVITTPAKGLKSVSDFATKMVSATPFKGGGIGAKAGNLAARMAGGAAVSYPVGGLYAAGEADAGQRGDAFLEGAGTAAAIGGALPLAGAVLGVVGGAAVKGAKNIKSGITARLPEELDDAAMAIKEQASRQYQRMRDAGAVFNPQATQKIQEELTQTLAKDGNLNPRLHDKVLAVYDDINQSLSKGAVGLEELDQWRQVLGDIAGNFSDKVNARKATLMIKSIDDLVEKVQPDDLLTGGVEAVDALRAGREAWARQSKFSAVADIVKNAGNDAYKLKRDLEKMLLNPKKHRGFSKVEMDALKTAARQTTGEGILKALGKFGFDIGSSRGVGNTGLPSIAGGMAGVGSLLTGGTGGIGLAIPAVGTVARSTQKALAFGKAEELLKVIEQGGKVTNQMIATLPQAEKNKFLKQVMQMPVAKAQEILGEKTKAAMQKTKQFAKDYIADESGALTISGNKTDKFIDYLKSKAKELGINVADIQKSKNRNGDYSSYIDLGKGRAKASLRLSDHYSNERYNTSSANIIIGDDAQTYKDIDTLLLKIKKDADLYEENYIQRELNKRLSEAKKIDSYVQQREAILRKIKYAKEKGYGWTFDKIPEYESQIEKLNILIDKNDNTIKNIKKNN